VPERNDEIEGFIKAPDNSPYKDGIFNFIIRYPSYYPERAPEIILKTQIFHINVYRNGKCCISHLLNYWDKNYDISMILRFLYEFFIRNNPDSPCRNDLADLYRRDYNLFLEKCQKFVNQYAFKQFNERLNYMFPNYTNVKLEFSNSNLIFVYNSKFITISKDKIKDKNVFDIGNILGINLKDKAFIVGNQVFDSELEFQDYLRYNISYHIIYVIPLIYT
jgi:ubiquitin-protein ligase